MASGKVHDYITGAIAVTVAVSASHYISQSAAVAMCLGSLSGLMIGPDNDLYQSHPSKRWLMLNELLFWPYRKWVGGHRVPSCRSCFGRNPKSHFPVLSTFPRLPYAALLLSPLLWLAAQDGIQGWEVAIAIQYILGLMAADIGHWAADGIG